MVSLPLLFLMLGPGGECQGGTEGDPGLTMSCSQGQITEETPPKTTLRRAKLWQVP